MTEVTRGEGARQGYARSLEELLRLALQRPDRPKRDCAITLHADFAHSPESMEDMVTRLESGADLVVAEQVEQRDGGRAWRALRLARRWAPRVLGLPGLRDPMSGFVALRLIVLRQSLRSDGTRLLLTDGWCASAELVARLRRHARRLDTVPAAVRYDLVQRPSRVRPWRQLLEAWRAGPLLSRPPNPAPRPGVPPPPRPPSGSAPPRAPRGGARQRGPDGRRAARRRRVPLLDPHRAARDRQALRVPALFPARAQPGHRRGIEARPRERRGPEVERDRDPPAHPERRRHLRREGRRPHVALRRTAAHHARVAVELLIRPGDAEAQGG